MPPQQQQQQQQQHNNNNNSNNNSNNNRIYNPVLEFPMTHHGGSLASLPRMRRKEHACVKSYGIYGILWVKERPWLPPISLIHNQ